MNEKYICIHGHFYQPPRENPWLNKVEIQDSAYPYHDWNHRINAECYIRNASSRILDSEGKIVDIMNNYAWMSFNIGPTLLAWMEHEAPETYEGILQADKESQERFSGHGAALAQAYNHLIMPLANQKDKETQVIWGIEDFKSRFGRHPEGMWLGETAANTETLEVLAEHDIKFTILSPYQAKRMRKIGDKEWEDATDAKVDPRRAYVCNLPSGKTINLFFYDGPASQGVAFEGLLDDGERFANRLKGQFSETENVQLVNIATDGESYGHHHKLGEMALSYCLEHIEENEDAKLTIYGEFLEKFPPQHEVEIIEDTSWSCYHGVERWRSDCGCNTGGNGDWNQKWRGPLRDSFDWVREELITLYEKEMKSYTEEPWKVRNRYVQVVLDRSKKNVEAFLEEQFGAELKEEEKIKLLKLLEMQYHTMLMYTSCGWFFDEVTGIESMQDIFYATRAIQLAEEISGRNYEATFEKYLDKIPSNMPEFDSALGAYNKYVKPMALDMIRIGAHYAVSSLFEEFPEEVSLYNFSATTKANYFYEAGKQKLVIGRTEFRSDITWEKVDISYAVLHMGDHHLFGGVREYIGTEALEDLHKNVAEFFKKGNVYEIFNMMDTYFGNHNYSFWHLFRDEQQSIMELVMENTLKSAEGAMQQVYDNSYPLLQTFKEIHMKVPNRLKLPAELAVNTKLVNELKNDNFNLKNFKSLLNSAKSIGVNLDVVTLSFLGDIQLNSLMRKLKKNPDDIQLLNCINEFVETLDESTLEPEKWEAQNVIFAMREEEIARIEKNAEKSHDGNGDKWMESLNRLTENLNLVNK
jgi:alpha-amylase/alpha-mannosidase (GH57 family)